MPVKIGLELRHKMTSKTQRATHKTVDIIYIVASNMTADAFPASQDRCCFANSVALGLSGYSFPKLINHT